MSSLEHKQTNKKTFFFPLKGSLLHTASSFFFLVYYFFLLLVFLLTHLSLIILLSSSLSYYPTTLSQQQQQQQQIILLLFPQQQIQRTRHTCESVILFSSHCLASISRVDVVLAFFPFPTFWPQTTFCLLTNSPPFSFVVIAWSNPILKNYFNSALFPFRSFSFFSFFI
ncbi:MAG: hypothetical protein J3R72DRAFT_59394 [Linnemannia gamsii]|nr:MAG: hypothetical protein J3R72DRAFT_59394 [Linnemannia gamsii]